jgi:DNA-binding transcriptional MerR regulator
MNAQPARGYLGISEVLAQLRADFPDISVSKIRFLETEGLIAPARSPAGYRRFCAQDVDRLRFILTAQRDHYLPLRVIRDRLDQQANAGADPAGWAAGRPGPQGTVSANGGPGWPGARHPDGAGQDGGPRSPLGDDGQAGLAEAADPPLSRRELVDAAGVSDALLTELETFGLVRRIGRNYAPESLEVARAAVALTSFGVEARHLRAVRAAAERETSMIESLVAPILRQRGAGARELAGRTARDCAALVLQLHRALVEGTLAEAGLAVGGPSGLGGNSAAAGQAAAGLAGADGRRARANGGVEGASA